MNRYITTVCGLPIRNRYKLKRETTKGKDTEYKSKIEKMANK